MRWFYFKIESYYYSIYFSKYNLSVIKSPLFFFGVCVVDKLGDWSEVYHARYKKEYFDFMNGPYGLLRWLDERGLQNILNDVARWAYTCFTFSLYAVKIDYTRAGPCKDIYFGPYLGPYWGFCYLPFMVKFILLKIYRRKGLYHKSYIGPYYGRFFGQCLGEYFGPNYYSYTGPFFEPYTGRQYSMPFVYFTIKYSDFDMFLIYLTEYIKAILILIDPDLIVYL